jgi:alkanesulfonate monooxygenase SsuD/methylene tetrahydromethanopterin reductase-like flavin-dependent oxidoreductase (luciferase family)
METRHDVIVRAAQLADELGFEAFAVPEGWGLDSTPLLAEVALRTRRITLCPPSSRCGGAPRPRWR